MKITPNVNEDIHDKVVDIIIANISTSPNLFLKYLDLSGIKEYDKNNINIVLAAAKDQRKAEKIEKELSDAIDSVGYVAEIQIYLLTRGSRIRYTLFYIDLVFWSNLALRAMYQFYTLFLVLSLLFFILLIFWKPLLLFSSMIFQ
jgi:hypothetical protein